MTHRTVVLNIVGLSRSLVPHAPSISGFAERSRLRTIQPLLPAVTCSAQASILTGRTPRDHGIVANGWYNRDLGEVHFWKQSNRLIQGEKLWKSARRRDPNFIVANLFWWFNMNAEADIAVTPRPQYAVDGRKHPDCLTTPPELRDELQQKLGTFPLFQFWGPGASIKSSQWINDAAKHVAERHHPSLLLVYLPHLDYSLQKLGPDHPSIPAEVRAVDDLARHWIDDCQRNGTRLIILSEYGIESVSTPIHINRALRESGLLSVRNERNRDILEPTECRVFAVADHQVAHVYVRDPADLPAADRLCRSFPGVDQVLDRSAQSAAEIDHERSGDLVLVAAKGCWFTYDFWLDDARAPDYARTVDIHRKPGYDPRELFLDPAIKFPRFAIARRLFARKLGFRTLMDVIPLDANLVRGSHGRTDVEPNLRPLFISSHSPAADPQELTFPAIHDLILRSLFD